MEGKFIKTYAWISLLIFIFLWLAVILLIHLYFDNFFIKFILSGLLFFFLLIFTAG